MIYPIRLPWRYGAAGLLVLGMGIAIAFQRAPAWLGVLYGVAGLVAFAAYGLDKARARRGLSRFRESNLHALDLAGGIIGGLVAQELFRHKTAKSGFSKWSAAIASAHAIGLVAIVSGALQPIGALAHEPSGEATALLAPPLQGRDMPQPASAP